MTMTPRVIDISHHNSVASFEAVASAGIWGVIHKATQGSSYRDPDYVKRRSAAKAAGLLWGAYHFNDGSDIVSQVSNFLRYADPDAETLLVLDFEDNPKSNMSITQAVQFLKLVETRGYNCAIYSGNRLKENIGKLSAADRAYLCEKLLWLCQYGPQARLPDGFTDFFLWQYTDGRVGPQPHTIPGVGGEVDLNVVSKQIDSQETLALVWHSGGEPTSSHTVEAQSDHVDSAPPVSRSGGPRPGRYDHRVLILQQDLHDMGYFTVGDLDGKWGSQTAGAVTTFYIDRGIEAVPAMNDQLMDAVDDAINENWQRPINDSRASAAPKDLKHLDTVRLSLIQRFWAKVAAGGAAVGLTGNSVSDYFSSVQDKMSSVKDAFAKVPPEAWFVLAGLLACAVWYASTKAAKATTSDYNKGRLN